MAVYGVALGGNKRTGGMWPGYSNLYASGNTAGNIDYAAHLKTRHKGLPFVWNGAGDDWQSWLHQETATGTLLVGDQLQTHWLNEGTNVEALYIHNKVAAAAATPGNATAVPPVLPTAATSIRVEIVNAAGVVVGTPATVNLTVPGFSKVPVGLLLQTNSFVRVTLLGGDLTTACFAAFADLFNAFDEHPCSCFVPGCDVPTPSPECFTPSSTC
jgi:hypothetical protein